MKNRISLLASLALCSLLLSGCAAAAGFPGAVTGPSSDAPSTSARPQPGSQGAQASQGPSHSGVHHDGGTASSRPAPDGPSDAAKMVCGDQPMERLSSILHLEQRPHTVNSWADSTFTCTYHLNEGALDISVREATDQASALTYFDAMQALAKDAKPIQGLANLGFPAYETEDGSAVFQKDSFVLQVDASDLPATIGPDTVTRNALAYQLSTTILACWVEHH
ncbi:hypothetical protein J7E83_20620 [Arthrobacter sp. ISL-48]|uniref:hypothetical protein n=1 Tax=Arthrobacter sp. ISL-48 TaxID=2819110 RepID=UPI001BE60A50|nr:hypothetical protein [Arthrobacter sp. ISL-48]MBT2534487.1 hypothetical protein [Arthrobacter sp. ISL-48]